MSVAATQPDEELNSHIQLPNLAEPSKALG